MHGIYALDNDLMGDFGCLLEFRALRAAVNHELDIMIELIVANKASMRRSAAEGLKGPVSASPSPTTSNNEIWLIHNSSIGSGEDVPKLTKLYLCPLTRR